MADLTGGLSSPRVTLWEIDHFAGTVTLGAGSLAFQGMRDNYRLHSLLMADHTNV
jgi:hypothetical protein